MIERVLQHFPAHTHALTVVSDPDGLLAEEGLLAELTRRGFALVSETDPLRLRWRVEGARPWSAERPLIVVTPARLQELPYDLWQQGQRVCLELHAFLPHLAYPVLQSLSPWQRQQLGQAPQPERPLGPESSKEYILRHVFGVQWEALQSPAGLLAWLEQYHQRQDPLPGLLARHVLEHLTQNAVFAGWPLAGLLESREAFAGFVREQWLTYVQAQSGEVLGEGAAAYVLSFEADTALQDAVPGLLRSGTLEPLAIEQPACLPRWARPAVVGPAEDHWQREWTQALEYLREQVHALSDEARWETWQALARTWARVQGLRYDLDAKLEQAQEQACAPLEAELDARFLTWLRRAYAPLGGQGLPVPHHVHHVPEYLAYEQRKGGCQRVALLVLDGLSLADWRVIGRVWQARHAGWEISDQLLLAQVPTITAISRQALVSGRRPAELASCRDNAAEAWLWAEFWAQHGLPGERCAYAHLSLTAEPCELLPREPGAHALCLVYAGIDEIVHGSQLGAKDVQASLRIWLDQKSPRLEAVLDGLLQGGYLTFLASDHGHVQAHGLGCPAEGLTVYTRAKRARVYADRRTAEATHVRFSDTLLWGADGLLPDELWAVIPSGRAAFALYDEVVVTHGGTTLDEVVVPLIQVMGRSHG